MKKNCCDRQQIRLNARKHPSKARQQRQIQSFSQFYPIESWIWNESYFTCWRKEKILKPNRIKNKSLFSISVYRLSVFVFWRDENKKYIKVSIIFFVVFYRIYTNLATGGRFGRVGKSAHDEMLCDKFPLYILPLRPPAERQSASSC